MSKLTIVFFHSRGSSPPAGLIQQPCSALQGGEQITSARRHEGERRREDDAHKAEAGHLRGDLLEVGLAPAREQVDGRRRVLGQVDEELDQVLGRREALSVGDARVDIPEQALKVDEQQALLRAEEVLLERVEL